MRLRDGTTIDRTGESFGFLTVVARAPNDAFGRVYWHCVCRCGASRMKSAHQLRAGKFFTCGSAVCRFWEKVYIPEGDSCHEWTGGLKDTGYGAFKPGAGLPTVAAHIFAWTQKHGPVPVGLILRHTCDYRPCVRDDHLVLGTHLDNSRDMVARGRVAHAEDKVYLAPQRIEALRADYLTGEYPQVALAEKYGVCLKTVGRHVKGLYASVRKDGVF